MMAYVQRTKKEMAATLKKMFIDEKCKTLSIFLCTMTRQNVWDHDTPQLLTFLPVKNVFHLNISRKHYKAKLVR